MALATPADLQASAAGRGLAACTDARCGRPRFGRQRGVRGAQLVVFGRGLGQMAIGEQVAAPRRHEAKEAMNNMEEKTAEGRRKVT